MTTAVEAQCAKDAIAITASDSTMIYADALFVGTGGDIAVTTYKGSSVTLTVPDGAIIPLTVTKVKSTGTTASGIVGLLY